MNENKQSVFMQWAKTSRQAKFNLATSGVMHYPLKDLGITIEELEISGPTFYGYEPLQKALAGKCGVDPACIAAAIGTSMANHLVLSALLEPGDEVLIEQPTYEPLLAVARYLEATIKRFRREFNTGFRIDPELIRKQITPKTKLIVLTNLHNPTGVLTPNETLREVGSIAKEAGAKVLVDEVYLECTFPESGKPCSAFHLGNEFITTSSLTKAYGLSGLRCGWILAEPELIRRFWRINDLFSATPPHTAELLSVIALKKLPQIAERSKNLLETNRRLLQKLVDSVNYFWETIIPQFGTIVFPRLKSGDTETFITTLRESYDTSVAPGSFFEMPEHFRLGIGSSTDNVRNGLQNLKKAIEET
ncbi:pyridoxal phosphate-dependent aminotransferase [bacterium]|nr:pyridoxal phosphate-dependent aminotransferase [bacterium]